MAEGRHQQRAGRHSRVEIGPGFGDPDPVRAEQQRGDFAQMVGDWPASPFPRWQLLAPEAAIGLADVAQERGAQDHSAMILRHRTAGQPVEAAPDDCQLRQNRHDGGHIIVMIGESKECRRPRLGGRSSQLFPGVRKGIHRRMIALIRAVAGCDASSWYDQDANAPRSTRNRPMRRACEEPYHPSSEGSPAKAGHVPCGQHRVAQASRRLPPWIPPGSSAWAGEAAPL